MRHALDTHPSTTALRKDLLDKKRLSSQRHLLLLLAVPTLIEKLRERLGSKFFKTIGYNLFKIPLARIKSSLSIYKNTFGDVLLNKLCDCETVYYDVTEDPLSEDRVITAVWFHSHCRGLFLQRLACVPLKCDFKSH